MSRLIIAFFLTLVCLVMSDANAITYPLEDSINQIMVAAHVRDIDGKGNRGTKRNLDTRVVSGQATDREKARLLELYEQLEKRVPPKGDLKEWKSRTAEMTASVKAIIAKEKGAETRLAKAINCAECHAKFRNDARPASVPPPLMRTPSSEPPVFDAFGSAPKLAITAGIKENQLLIKEISRETRLVPKSVSKEVAEEIEGKVRKKVVNEIVYEPVQVSREIVVKIPVGKIKIYDLDGNPLPENQVVKHLSDPATILYSEVGNPINAAYLKAARPGIYFVLLPVPDKPK